MENNKQPITEDKDWIERFKDHIAGKCINDTAAGYAAFTCFEIAKEYLAASNKVSDAIQFKDWCDSGAAWFFDNNEQHTHTTEELYSLFKANPLHNVNTESWDIIFEKYSKEINLNVEETRYLFIPFLNWLKENYPKQSKVLTDEEIKKIAESFADSKDRPGCGYYNGLFQGYISGYKAK